MANTQTFTGDGATTAFNFTFPFFGVNDIHASINNVEVTSSNFTIAPNATPDDADIQYTGGTITFTTAPANGTTIKVWRHVELTRHIDYQPTLQPQSYQLNQDLNQCMEILKEQNETLTNVISLANIPTVSDLLSELSGIRDRLDDFLTADDLTDINTAIEDIPGKANKDMDNLSATGASKISGFCLPDYGSKVTLDASPYTAPSNGFIAINNYGSNPSIQIQINGVEFFNTAIAASGSAISCFIPVSKDDVVTYSGGGTNNWKYFIPMKEIN